MSNLSSKKILIIIAHKNYQDYEYAMTKQILESAGTRIITASSRTGAAQGEFGSFAQIDLSLNQVKTKEYEAIIFIGGPGAIEYWKNDLAHKIISQAIKENKILAAICIAPIILAEAGALKGKKATVWSSEEEKRPIDVLKKTRR